MLDARPIPASDSIALSYLVSKEHLKEYVENSSPRRSLSPPSASKRPIVDTILAAPKSTHAWGQPHVGIFVARVSYSFASGSAQPVYGLLTFSESPLMQLARPHDDALVLTLKVGWHLIKRILVNPGSATDLLYLPALIRLGYKPDNLRNPRRVLVGFNGT